MSKCVWSSFVPSAPFALTALAAVLATVACSSNPEETPGTAGASGSVAQSGSGGASSTTGGTTAMTNGGATTAGTTTGGAAGSTNTAGASGSASGGANTGGSGAGTSAGGGAAGAGGSGAGTAGSGSGGGGAADCSTLKLCDGFEGDAPGVGASPWKVTQGNGYTVAVDATQAHGGTKSIHISAPKGAGSGVLKETKTFPATDFWGRAWMRFKTAAGGHQMFIAVLTQGDQFRLFNTLGSDSIQLNEQQGDKFFKSSTTVPMDKWFCYEWHVTANAASVFVDGKELTDAKPTGWNIANPNGLQIGYQRFQDGPSAGEIWLDDIALNTAQIGCQ